MPDTPRCVARMRRRELVAVLGGVAAAPLFWLPSAYAQQSPARVRRVGMLLAWPEDNAEGKKEVAAFREGLRKTGWIEGENLEFVYRWMEPDADAIERCAKELVALQPEIILSSGTPTTAALMRQNLDDPHRVHGCRGPDRRRLCRKHGAAGRQRDRLHQS
jgi:hypothetical protein